MGLSYLMLTGSLSGLLSILGHSVLWSAIEATRPRAGAAPLQVMPQVSEALLHMLCGLGLGLTFWLSWGFAALVGVPWWVRGFSFAGLCWLSFSLPSLIGLAAARNVPLSATALLASRWATTFLIAGLACSWTWEKTF